MSDPKSPVAPAGHPAGPVAAPIRDVAPAYEAPTLVEVGTLRDLTAAGSFGDPT